MNRLAVGFSYDTSRTDFARSTQLGVLTEDRSVEGLGTQILQADSSFAPAGLKATRTGELSIRGSDAQQMIVATDTK
ncbi:MAG: hypothetical protein H6917_04105 [Novosphingobium sp.]|nr:hypothetical protein [Novosphingobium sp.]MCP5401556.1 hypothetical protein [Novosphingobium sp.]